MLSLQRESKIMAKMHENELEIDEDIVHRLLKQCPHWTNMNPF